MDDTTLLVNENLLRDIVKIFKAEPSVRLIGVKGAKQLPDSGIIEEADSIYGGLYEMNSQGEVFEKKYNNEILNENVEFMVCDYNGTEKIGRAHV